MPDQRLKERLAIVREWAEAHPYSGMHDAPSRVKKAIGYRGTGAKILAERLERSARPAATEEGS